MTTNWEPEQEEQDAIIDGNTWDNMPVQERVERAVRLGVSGRYGSKSWSDLTVDEKAVLSGKLGDVKLEYQVKAHIVFEDSDKENWGIVRDPGYTFDPKPGEGVIVGTWSRSTVDGLMHAFLETSIAALHDKATQNYYDYVERRKRLTELAPKTKKSRSTRKTKEPEVPERNEALDAIANLRSQFKK